MGRLLSFLIVLLCFCDTAQAIEWRAQWALRPNLASNDVYYQGADAAGVCSAFVDAMAAGNGQTTRRSAAGQSGSFSETMAAADAVNVTCSIKAENSYNCASGCQWYVAATDVYQSFQPQYRCSSSDTWHTVPGVACPAGCQTQTGQYLDLPDGLDVSLTEACLEGCKVTPFIGLSISTKKFQNGPVSYGIVQGTSGHLGTSCDVSEMRLSQKVTNQGLNCKTVGDSSGSVTGCLDKAQKKKIADGIVHDPTTNTDSQSGTTYDDLIGDSSGCKKLSSGGSICFVGAAGTPNDGREGQPATPDGTFVVHAPFGNPNGTSDATYNYFNSSTVSNSTNQGPATPDASKTGNCGAPGQPACSTKTTCGGAGQLACSVKIDEGGGSGNTFNGPADPEPVPEFGQALTTFKANIGASPIASAMGGIANGIPTGGAAPTASFSAFNRTFVYAVPREVENAIRPVLSLVMKLVWSMVAIIVFMKS